MEFPGGAAPAGGWTDWHEPGAHDVLDALDIGFPAEQLADLGALLTRDEAARGPPSLLRCLEGHPADCATCCAPPAPDQFGSYVLLGQSGTKRLRRAVLLTREWNTTADREAAATLAETSGDPHGVARVLRGKLSRELSKPHLLLLCATWRYRSDLWAPKGDTCRKRARPAPDAVVETAASALALHHRLPMVGAIDRRSVAQLVATLSAQLTASARDMAGPKARAVTLEHRLAPFEVASLQEYNASSVFFRAVSMRWGLLEASQVVWSARAAAVKHVPYPAEEADPATTPTWQLLALCDAPAPLEAQLEQLRAIASSAQRMVVVTRSTAQAMVPPGSPERTVVDVAQREYAEAIMAGVAVCTSVVQLLAQLRAAAPLADYAAACELLSPQLTRYMAGLSDSARARSEWSAAAISDGVQPRPPWNVEVNSFTTFFDVAAVAAPLSVACRVP